jgi:Animal haem peroxidase
MRKMFTKLAATFSLGGPLKLSHAPTWRTSLLSIHVLLAVLLTALPLASSPASADEEKEDRRGQYGQHGDDQKGRHGKNEKQPMFGRMFPKLPAYDAPSDEALTALTAAVDATGAPGPLFDENLAADNNPANVPAFLTYFGQFLDHDMTLDTLPLPTMFVDPTTIPNSRDPRLNLDSVFGGGPEANPELYETDRKHLKVNGRDLPRNPDGSAILVEGRNDENQVIAQIHVAFLRAYNRLIDQGRNVEHARNLMRWRYQWIVVHEFLPEVLDPDVYADVFRPNGDIETRYYDPKRAAKAEMPVEFSVAAYRFGHSQVRRAYRITEGGPGVQVFNTAGDDLHGGRPITQDHVIFWPNFLTIDGQPPTGPAGTNQPANIGRKVDTLLSSGLFFLPIPGAEPAGSAILAKRNIQRARGYGLPSGQAVAARLRIPVLTNQQIIAAIPRLAVLNDPAYKGETPLWLYILAEAQIVRNGATLGPVGSRIVAEVFGGLLASDVRSYYRRGWNPDGGIYRSQDLLREAGVL